MYVLRKNRANLHRADCDDPQRQRVVEKEFGSIYVHYTPDSFYFDVVDLLRRLILTGGLIMMGEESVAQIFLGVVVCVGWLCLLLYKRPYVVWWDNVIAIVLALQNPKNPKSPSTFDPHDSSDRLRWETALLIYNRHWNRWSNIYNFRSWTTNR